MDTQIISIIGSYSFSVSTGAMRMQLSRLEFSEYIMNLLLWLVVVYNILNGAGGYHIREARIMRA